MTNRRTVLLDLALAASLFATPGQAAMANETDKDAVQAILWAKEQAIYEARRNGNLAPYIESVARDYSAWPPFRPAPAGLEGLRQLDAGLATNAHEVLTMRFVSLAYNGDTAIIYYQTHRTRLPDGRAVDETFDVTHTWVRQEGQWKVLGGMARERKPSGA